MSSVVQADNTYAAIERVVRELTASASESALPSTYIQGVVNDVYNNDFAYAIKIDQMRNVYTFYTQPFIDRYPLDVNYNMGVRAPVYFEGIQGSFYKDRTQFYNLWPRFPTKFQQGSADGQNFSFTLPGPFLSKEVTMGSIDNLGNPINLCDDGNGNILYTLANPVISTPAQNTNPAIPGMYNRNLGNPGLIQPTVIGTVNYVTGVFAFTLPNGLSLGAGQLLNIWISQYQPGRSYSMMFWNNEFTIRPVPDNAYKVEVETYLTPVQFMQTTDSPILNQWWKYIAYLAAAEILRRRQDVEGLNYVLEGLKRQEGLVLERQGVEEINQPTITLFNSTNGNYFGGYWNQGFFG